MKLLIKIATMFCSIFSSLWCTILPLPANLSACGRSQLPQKNEASISLSRFGIRPTPAANLSHLGRAHFFVGTRAMLEAPIARGKYPLILLSHGAGLGGSPEAMSWIATPLAKHEFIVAAPTHPGNTGANRSAAETMKLWLRPADISATLGAVEKQPLFENHLEPERVGVLGLSMGGSTALALAGARIDPIRLASYCDTDAKWHRSSRHGYEAGRSEQRRRENPVCHGD